MTSAIYNLPIPPSVNQMFPLNINTGGRGISKQYETWRTDAGWELKQQKARPICGPVEIHIVIREPSRRSDIDNRIKPLLDLLVKHGIIDGDHDKTVRKVSAAWGDVERAQVEIRSV